MKESMLQRKVLKFMESVMYVRRVSMSNRAGTPDIMGCIGGKFVSVEVKSEGGKLSQLQLLNASEISLHGGHHFVVYPKTFEYFKEAIMEMRRNTP